MVYITNMTKIMYKIVRKTQMPICPILGTDLDKHVEGINTIIVFESVHAS